MKFAVIQTGGKQYIVKPGDTIKIEKLVSAESDKITEGSKVSFDQVLLVDEGDSTTIGTPYIDGAKVSGVVTEEGRDRKVITRKYKAKVRYRNKKGHRQPYMNVLIEAIK
ncbi:MAG: 50S ribosomal protein L21 [bacterium]